MHNAGAAEHSKGVRINGVAIDMNDDEIDPLEYDGKDDAEALLEGVLNRSRWSADVRDALAEKLIQVRHHNQLRPKSKKSYHSRAQGNT